MTKMRLCIICKKRPAIVPDRERMGRPIPRVCRECHAGKLRGDLEHIMAVEAKKRLEDER